MDELINVKPELPPKYSGKLHGIIKHDDGTKTIIYDGVEVAITSVQLTPAEQAEVENA